MIILFFKPQTCFLHRNCYFFLILSILITVSLGVQEVFIITFNQSIRSKRVATTMSETVIGQSLSRDTWRSLCHYSAADWLCRSPCICYKQTVYIVFAVHIINQMPFSVTWGCQMTFEKGKSMHKF